MAQINLEQTISGLLDATGVRVPHGYIRRHISAHNEEDSMLCITDLLDALNVPHAAVEIAPDQLSMLPEPYLAYSTANGGEFILINNTKNYLAAHPDFTRHWNGVVIVTEPGENINTYGFKEFEVAHTWWQILIVAGVALLAGIIAGMFTQFSVWLSLAGLATGILIKGKSWGIASGVADKLCNAMGSQHCDSVIKSEGSRLFGWLELSDGVLIYFFAQLLFAALGHDRLTALWIGSLLALPVTIYSMYHQVKNKQWCALCMVVNMVIWVQAIIWSVMEHAFQFDIIPGIIAVAAAALVVFLLNRLVYYQQRYENTMGRLQRFKLHEDYLLSKIPTENSYPDFAIHFGNPHAALQLTVACAPNCNPCAALHELLEEILVYKGAQCGVHICFYYKEGNNDILHILQAIRQQDAHEVLRIWYSNQRDAILQIPYDQSTIDTARLQGAWCSDMLVTHTPTIFINGQPLKDPYTFYDLPLLLPVLIHQLEERLQPTIQ
jgi:uncharacterized membrane protein